MRIGIGCSKQARISLGMGWNVKLSLEIGRNYTYISGSVLIPNTESLSKSAASFSLSQGTLPSSF